MVTPLRAALLVSSILVLAASAAAQDAPPSEADRHVSQGEALFEAANYDAALAEFEAAYELLEGTADRYFLLWNIGQCHERLFRYDRALEYYQRYLDEGGPEAEDRATVEATMRALDGLLGEVTIDVNVDGAEVAVDGHVVDTAPGTIRLAGGIHSIEVRAAGHASEVREVQIAARQTLHIEITLHIISDYQGVDPWLFWSSGALAVASALVGGGLGIAALVDSSNVARLVPDLRSQEDRDRIASLALGADILYGTAGVFATTALVLAFLTNWDGSPATSEATAFLLPVPSPDGLGVVAGGTW